MQQLTLQFDGYAPIGQAKTQGTAKQCHRVKISEFSIGWALKQLSSSSPVALQRMVSRVKLFSQAAAAVTFGFGLMFLAAIIGG